MSIDRERLVALLTALDASPRCLERPVCLGWLGDWQITGKHGHAMPDGLGFLLYVKTEGSPRRWTNAKGRLAFCQLRQDGDDEGTLHLDRLPTPAEAELIRGALGIRRKRQLSAEAKAALADRLLRKPTGSPSDGRHPA